MNQPAMNNNRPLVGQACYVAKPHLHASKGGTVTDVAPLAREYLVRHDSGLEAWYDFSEVVALAPIEASAEVWEEFAEAAFPANIEPFTEDHAQAADDRAELVEAALKAARFAGEFAGRNGMPLMYHNSVREAARREAEAARAAALKVPTYDTARAVAEIRGTAYSGSDSQSGTVAVGRVAFVPKG